MYLFVLFLASIFLVTIVTNSLSNELFAQPFTDDREYCSDYNGIWNSEEGKCEFINESNKEAYIKSICKNPEEAKHYPEIC